MLSSKQWNNEASDINLVYLYSTVNIPSVVAIKNMHLTPSMYMFRIIKAKNAYYIPMQHQSVVGRDSSVGKWLATSWMVRGSNPRTGGWGDEIFRSRPNQHRGPPSLLYNGNRVSLLGVKRPGRGADHPPHPLPTLDKRIRSIPPLPLCVFVACFMTNLYILFRWMPRLKSLSHT